MREADLHRHAEERFAWRRASVREPPRERSTSRNLAWKAWNNSATTVTEETRHAPLTADMLSQHDAEMDEADRPILSAADMARRNGKVNDQRNHHLLRDDFNFGKIGWRRAERRGG